jgi:hypothetical protein
MDYLLEKGGSHAAKYYIAQKFLSPVNEKVVSELLKEHNINEVIGFLRDFRMWRRESKEEVSDGYIERVFSFKIEDDLYVNTVELPDKTFIIASVYRKSLKLKRMLK